MSTIRAPSQAVPFSSGMYASIAVLHRADLALVHRDADGGGDERLRHRPGLMAGLGVPSVLVEVTDDPAVVDERDDVGLGRPHELAQRLRLALPLIGDLREVALLPGEGRGSPARGDRGGRQEGLGLHPVDRRRKHDRPGLQEVADGRDPEVGIGHDLGAPGGEIGRRRDVEERIDLAALGRAQPRPGDLSDDRLGDLGPRDGGPCGSSPAIAADGGAARTTAVTAASGSSRRTMQTETCAGRRCLRRLARTNKARISAAAAASRGRSRFARRVARRSRARRP